MSLNITFFLLMAILRGPGNDGGSYSNPIISGNWSDPAVIRVGGDFYSVCSTTCWQPGATIMHSRDLVHWRYLGCAYRQHPEIPAGRTNAGCWGLEMGYNPTCPGMGKGKEPDKKKLEKLVLNQFVERMEAIAPTVQRLRMEGKILPDARIYRTMPGKRRRPL